LTVTVQKYLRTTKRCNIRGEDFHARHKSNDSGVPLVLHDDGAVCWPVTDWLISLLREFNKSMSTLRTYADHVSMFLRYLDANKLGLRDTSNAVLYGFRNELIKPEHDCSNDQINKVIRRLLAIFIYLQQKGYFGSLQVIGRDTENPNAQVVYSYRDVNVQVANGKMIRRNTIWHPALLPPGVKRQRFPIATSTIDKLWEAVSIYTKDAHAQFRAELMLLLFESSGKRRLQVDRLTVQSISKAEKSKRLSFIGVKGGDFCEVPIPPETILKAIAYINGPRKDLIANAIRRNRLTEDHGYLLVSRWGTPWDEKSISNEFLKLKKAAGIEEPAFAHLFRNRWMTLQATELAAHVDSPMARSTLATKLRSRSAHKSDGGVAPYIDLGFEERNIWKPAEERLDQISDQQSVKRLFKALSRKLESAGSSEEAKAVAEELTALLKRAFPEAS
jgi:site-specific recombinase XerD